MDGKGRMRMTVRECYEYLGASYDDVLSRFGSEELVERFAIRFLSDQSFCQLRDALEKGDGEAAFRAAHTLKGVCMNLGFGNLYSVSAALTEKLRGNQIEGSKELFKKVEKSYIDLVTILEQIG